jgi:hypothetical protein
MGLETAKVCQNTIIVWKATGRKMQRFDHDDEIPLTIMRGNGALLLYLLDD